MVGGYLYTATHDVPSARAKSPGSEAKPRHSPKDPPKKARAECRGTLAQARRRATTVTARAARCSERFPIRQHCLTDSGGQAAK